MYLCFPESYKLYFFPSWFLRIDTSLSLAFSVPTLCITLILYIDSGWGFRWCQWVRRTAACTWSPRATMSSFASEDPRHSATESTESESWHSIELPSWGGVCQDQRWIQWIQWIHDNCDSLILQKKKEWHFLTLSFGKLLWMPCHPSLHPGTPWLSVLFSSG